MIVRMVTGSWDFLMRKINLPLKLVMSVDSYERLTTKVGYKGQAIKQIRVLTTEGVERPSTVEEIQEIGLLGTVMDSI